LQAAQRAYRISMTDPRRGVEHPSAKQCLLSLQVGCGFTITNLQPISQTRPFNIVEECLRDFQLAGKFGRANLNNDSTFSEEKSLPQLRPFAPAKLKVPRLRLRQPKVALQAARGAYNVLAAHPSYGAKHPVTKRYLKVFQSKRRVKLVIPQSGSALSEEKSSSRPRPPTASISSAKLSSQQGMASQGVRQAQQHLGQAVLALLAAINTQRQSDWDVQAHANFTAIVVSAFAKGDVAFQYLCENPKLNSIPAALGQFIQAYVTQHPELHTLSTYPGVANALKRELIKGNLDALYARFGTPKPKQEPVEEIKNACALM